ncbi:MAG: hypothetical protein V4597_10535 [Pseudomonadota bacterium]
MSGSQTAKSLASWGVDSIGLHLLLATVAIVSWVILLSGALRPTAERAEEARLCEQAVRELVHATDSVSVDRSAFIIDKLRCDVVKASLAK